MQDVVVDGFVAVHSSSATTKSSSTHRTSRSRTPSIQSASSAQRVSQLAAFAVVATATRRRCSRRISEKAAPDQEIGLLLLGAAAGLDERCSRHRTHRNLSLLKLPRPQRSSLKAAPHGTCARENDFFWLEASLRTSNSLGEASHGQPCSFFFAGELCVARASFRHATGFRDPADGCVGAWSAAWIPSLRPSAWCGP